MKIHNSGSEIQRSGYVRGASGSTEAGAKPTPTQPVAPVSRTGDQIQISDAGRALAARASESVSPSGRLELTAERVGEIRQRILEGAYNSLDVVDDVARRMLERGDI